MEEKNFFQVVALTTFISIFFGFFKNWRKIFEKSADETSFKRYNWFLVSSTGYAENHKLQLERWIWQLLRKRK